MEVINRVLPNGAQMAGFLENPEEGPIYMVNLLKLKEKAEYPDGRATDLTGAQAFGIYGQAVAKILMELGGGLMFSASIQSVWLGEVEEPWDAIAIGMYPNRKTLHDMLSSADYQDIVIHRTAGLAGQLNIETTDPSGMWLMRGGDSQS